MIYFAVVHYSDDDSEIIGITTDEKQAQQMKEFAIAHIQGADAHDFGIEDFDDGISQFKPLWRTRYTRGEFSATLEPWRMLYTDAQYLSRNGRYDNWSWYVYADTKEEAIKQFTEKLKSDLSPWEKAMGKINLD